MMAKRKPRPPQPPKHKFGVFPVAKNVRIVGVDFFHDEVIDDGEWVNDGDIQAKEPKRRQDE